MRDESVESGWHRYSLPHVTMDAVLIWFAILALAAFVLIKLVGRRSGTLRSTRGESRTVEGGSGALAVRDLGWSVLTGVAGSLVSIGAGLLATAVTFDPDEGATFIVIWFWLAGPPVSAVAMATVVRLRHWDPPAVGVHAVVAFLVCVLCGLVALGAVNPRFSAPPTIDRPPTTDLGPTTPNMPSSTEG
ncbi:MAG TPA: hypothetical protein VMN58_07605 [Acidimicrobiales bacterium]|nr:hypothetical protein [Acidimicrobiales bacterium]